MIRLPLRTRAPQDLCAGYIHLYSSLVVCRSSTHGYIASALVWIYRCQGSPYSRHAFLIFDCKGSCPVQQSNSQRAIILYDSEVLL